MTRYVFDEVRAALQKEWGYVIERGEPRRANGKHDGRWDVTHATTGYIVSGNMPGFGHRHRWFRSLSDVVRVCKLTEVLAKGACS